MEHSTLSIVVPVYNGSQTLPELVSRVLAVPFEGIDQLEIIFVNDNSRDNSWAVIEQLAAQYDNVCGINLMRNYGQHNALLAGIRSARHHLIVTMDDDLQNPPEELPRMLATLREGYDLVYGAPQKEQHGFWRDVASQLTKLMLQGAMGVENASKVGAFRLFYTKLRDAFTEYHGAYVSLDVLLTWGTTNVMAIDVRHDKRTQGTSNYTLRKLMTHALNMITGFSVLPLQIASWIGFSCTFFGLLILLFVLGRFAIQGQVVPGFAFLASIIAIFSGAQLFAIGIIGEYLARIHFGQMGKPSYTVRTEIRRGESSDG